MSLKTEPTVETEVKPKSMPVLKWMKIVDPNGSKPTPRHGHRAVAMKDLLIIFGGENDDTINELHVYNATNNQWFTPHTSGDKPPGLAAYGLVIDNTRLLIFGGMLECGKYSNDLYELQIWQWHWSKLNAMPPIYHRSPCPRMGHSFTLIDNTVYLFGGLTNERRLNDLYTLNISSPNTLAWDVPKISSLYPPPRESHSAVAYTDSRGQCKLIIYGGTNGYRLGDIWTLDINTMSWNGPIVLDPSPLPRSLHTAITVQNCMFVFGGWVPFLDKKGNLPLIQNKWKCSNWFGFLHLETMTWTELNKDTIDDSMPAARAGHCAAHIGTKMYVWSGHSGYKTSCNNLVCYEDFWCIEVGKPQKCTKPCVVREIANELEIQYHSVPTADAYVLQIQKYDFSSTMFDYSLLPFLTSELAKKKTDSEDYRSVFINTNSAVTPNNPNEKIEILSQCSNVNSSFSIKDEQFHFVTVQATGNIQIKTVQSTYTRPSLLQNVEAVSLVTPESTTSIKSPSTDVKLSDSRFLHHISESVCIPDKAIETINILPHTSTINSPCFINCQQFTPVTAQEPGNKKKKTVHNTIVKPPLPQNSEAVSYITPEGTIFVGSSSGDIMQSDYSLYTLINNNSAANSNENIHVLPNDFAVNTLYLINNQLFTPVTTQEIRNQKIKTVQGNNDVPLPAQHFKGINPVTPKSIAAISSPSMDMLSNVAAVSATLNVKINVMVSSDQNELPKPNFKKHLKMAQTKVPKNDIIYPSDITGPQHQAVSKTRPVLQTPVAKKVLKMESNVLGNQVVLQNLGGPQSNFAQFAKTSQGNRNNQNIQVGKMIGTSVSNKPSILKCINPMKNRQSSHIRLNPSTKTVPLNTINARLPVAVNKSTFVITKGNTNISAFPQLTIVTTGSNLRGTQTFSASQAHITNRTSVSNSPIKIVTVSSGTLNRGNPVTITRAAASTPRKTVTSGESNLITTGGKTVSLKKVGGQNNMAPLTSNSGGDAHTKNTNIVSTRDTAISEIDSIVPSSDDTVTTNLPTRNRPILKNLLMELGIIDSTNACIDDIEESTDYTMEESENRVQKDKATMTDAASTESALTRLEVETGMVDLTNTSPYNLKESIDYTMEELENLIQEEDVDCVEYV